MEVLIPPYLDRSIFIIILQFVRKLVILDLEPRLEERSVLARFQLLHVPVVSGTCSILTVVGPLRISHYPNGTSSRTRGGCRP